MIVSLTPFSKPPVFLLGNGRCSLQYGLNQKLFLLLEKEAQLIYSGTDFWANNWESYEDISKKSEILLPELMVQN